MCATPVSRAKLAFRTASALTDRALMVFLTVGIAAFSSVTADAQQCQPQYVSGTVTIGDGSIPSTPTYQLFDCCAACNPCLGYGHQLYGGVTLPIAWIGVHRFTAYNAWAYSPIDMGLGVSCTEVAGCTQCGGTFNITVYSCQGAMDGFVTYVPSGRPAAEVQVYGAYGPTWQWGGQAPLAYTDASGYYLARTPNQPNNWGVGVDCDGWGPGLRAYRVATPGSPTTVDTFVSSNVLSRADLQIPESWLEEPTRGCLGQVGRPVDVATGNVYFDHVDAEIPSVGQGLRLVRSYNSQLALAAAAVCSDRAGFTPMSRRSPFRR